MRYTVDSLRPRLAEFLTPLIQHAGFELDYQLQSVINPHPEVENPEVTVSFSGADVDLLLNNRAELLLSLEHLSMEALRVPPEDHSLISFDAHNYRLLRVEELRLSALAAAEKVKRTHTPFHFNPMTSRERRVIHLALREEKELRSESVGLGPARAVVVVPSDMPTPPALPAPPRGPRTDSFNRSSDERRGPGGRPGFGGSGNRPSRGDRGRPR